MALRTWFGGASSDGAPLIVSCHGPKLLRTRLALVARSNTRWRSEAPVDLSKAQSRFAALAWLRPVLQGKQFQTADVVGRQSSAGLRRCSHDLSLKHCLAALAVPLLLSPRASRRLSSMCFNFRLRLKTTRMGA